MPLSEIGKIYSKAAKIKLAVFDFDGVFTDNHVIVSEDGSESVICSRSDGLGLEMLRKAAIKTLVISTEKNSVVSKRYKKLGIRCIQSCEDKEEILKKETSRLSIALSEVSYMGNDINDAKCLEIVGFPVCVFDAYPPLKKKAVYVTKRRGGHGAVREFCELIIKAKSGAKYCEKNQ